MDKWTSSIKKKYTDLVAEVRRRFEALKIPREKRMNPKRLGLVCVVLSVAEESMTTLIAN
jgi:hypothetical protein